MAINFDNALGIHPLALKFRNQRTELLASNLANADTPNFKAKDLDFQTVLKGVASSGTQVAVTQEGHQRSASMAMGPEQMYRTPSQPSLDGNTVETELEQMRFAENAVQYQTSLQFLSGKFIGLKTAIGGK